MHHVIIYTDGSCLGNPGNGGWAAILTLEGSDTRKEISGGFAMTTNNRMEITGVLEALGRLTEPCRVSIYSDSQYVCNAISRGWLKGWVKNNWIKSDTKPTGCAATRGIRRTSAAMSSRGPAPRAAACPGIPDSAAPASRRAVSTLARPQAIFQLLDPHRGCAPQGGTMDQATQEKTRRPEPVITVHLMPGDRKKVIRRPKTVLQLLQALGVMEETALVIRDGELLTIDRHISAGDTITVQSVVSVG